MGFGDYLGCTTAAFLFFLSAQAFVPTGTGWIFNLCLGRGFLAIVALDDSCAACGTEASVRALAGRDL